MRTFLQRILLIIIPLVAAPVVGSSLESTVRVWTFDEDSPGMLPAEFQVGTLFDGRHAGEWKVLDTDRARSSPRVLAQLLGKGAEELPESDGVGSCLDSDEAFFPPMPALNTHRTHIIAQPLWIAEPTAPISC